MTDLRLSFPTEQLLVAVPVEPSERPFVAVHNPSKLPAFSLASLPDTHLSLPYPLILSPVASEQFFEPTRGFDPSSFLKNPLLLIGGLSAVLMLGLPYLTVRPSALSPRSFCYKEVREDVRPVLILAAPRDASQSQLDPELIKEAQEMIQPAAGKASPAWGSSVGSSSGGGNGGVTAAAAAAGGPAKRAAGRKSKR